ncbi:FHA domain-containing protein [Candidatus Woesearchaeota archaeon]|nr:FHA domain-containing protein [Candidatus Woesearchaeota archaeon]
MAELVAKVVQLHEMDFVSEQFKFIKKPLNSQITIGRNEGNDITFNESFVSRTHGKIFLEHGFFSEHLDYEDFSSVGTTIIQWQAGEGKSTFVKGGPNGKKFKIKPGDWIIISSPLGNNRGLRYGLIIIPFIK